MFEKKTQLGCLYKV